MSAIARYFLAKGLFVAGYDKVETPLTRQLVAEGAKIHYDEDVKQIPYACRLKEECLVVYTPAIPQEHAEFQWFKARGFKIEKRAQVLGEITTQLKGLCVAGTHGKTTTSTMCAHILHQSRLDCNAFLGGISKNYGTNYILAPDSKYVVIEADEYDRSFHWLRPWMTIITSTDADHLDIYETEAAYLESFDKYAGLVQKALIVHKQCRVQIEAAEPQNGEERKVYSYSRDEGDFHAENIRIGEGRIVFDFVSPIENVADIELGQPIAINIENGVAAMAMAQLNGCTAEELRNGMQSFKGVDRRFDIKINTPEKALLSDYAHHPQEIAKSVESIKQLFAGRKVTAIFQPHLYSRTRDFYADFAKALSGLDQVVLCEIYPAREQPIKGVTSEIIYNELAEGVEKVLINSSEIMDWVQNNDFDVLAILGAGSIDDYVEKIRDYMS